MSKKGNAKPWWPEIGCKCRQCGKGKITALKPDFYVFGMYAWNCSNCGLHHWLKAKVTQ